MPYLVSALPQILIVVALIVLGVVFAPKVGPARGRMWAGLVLLAVLQVVSVVSTLLVPALVRVRPGMSMSLYGAVFGIIGVVTSVLMVVAIGLLVSAIALGRGGGSAPPSAYSAGDHPGVGHPGVGYPGSQQQPPHPGGGPDGGPSPYLRP